MNKISISIAMCLLALPGLTLAAEASSANVPTAGVFVGLGGGYNSVNFDQNLSGTGASSIYSEGNQVAYGTAGGSATSYNNTQSTFTPDLQIGYFSHFANSDLLWGVKLFYKYLDITTNNQAVNIPQAATFTNTIGMDTFTGRVNVASTQTSMSHQYGLMPFIGHTFKNGFVYLGAGPELFKVQSKVNNVSSYADINGTHYDVTGTTNSFSDSRWIWGGGVQVGMNYYFAPTWSVDVNYTFSMTQRYSINDTAPFNSAFNGYTDAGTLYVNNSQRMRVQGIMLTINKTF